jgi:hypothetical protein
VVEFFLYPLALKKPSPDPPILDFLGENMSIHDFSTISKIAGEQNNRI